MMVSADTGTGSADETFGPSFLNSYHALAVTSLRTALMVSREMILAPIAA